MTFGPDADADRAVILHEFGTKLWVRDRLSGVRIENEPSHFVACLLEADVRRRLWAELRAGRLPAEALAEVGLPGEPV